MATTSLWSRLPARVGFGLLAGAAIAFVDNIAFHGEVGPIVIVVLLLAATGAAGALGGNRGWVAAAVTWACIPLPHLVKHVLGLADTLHPNTYVSIVYLALFTFVIALIGTGVGVLIRGLATGGGEKRA